MCNLGQAYAVGDGVCVNIGEANKWFRPAAATRAFSVVLSGLELYGLFCFICGQAGVLVAGYLLFRCSFRGRRTARMGDTLASRKLSQLPRGKPPDGFEPGQTLEPGLTAAPSAAAGSTATGPATNAPESAGQSKSAKKRAAKKARDAGYVGVSSVLWRIRLASTTQARSLLHRIWVVRCEGWG